MDRKQAYHNGIVKLLTGYPIHCFKCYDSGYSMYYSYDTQSTVYCPCYNCEPKRLIKKIKC